MGDLIIFILVIAALIALILKTSNYAYKQGQIDAIHGKIQYELRQNEDGSKSWKKINEDI